MNRLWLISAAILLSLALVIGLVASPEDPRTHRSSLGYGPIAYRASFELLSELGHPVSRSYKPFAARSTEAPQYLPWPDFLMGRSADPNADLHEFLSWVEAGGTAVIFGDEHLRWDMLGWPKGDRGERKLAKITGDWLAEDRVLQLPYVERFASDPHASTVHLRADGEPFMLETPYGDGRLIGIADGRFLLNSVLDEAGASTLLVNLVQALGVPVFDERSHGLRERRSWVGSLGVLPLALMLVSLLLVVAAWSGERNRWPVRRLQIAEGLDPSLSVFVASLGTLYARNQDHAAIFRAYRSGFLHRLRTRVLHRSELTDARLRDWIAADQALTDEQRRWLVDAGEPRDRGELRSAVRALETYAEGKA